MTLRISAANFRKITFLQKISRIFIAAGYTGNTSLKYSQVLSSQWEKMKEQYPAMRNFLCSGGKIAGNVFAAAGRYHRGGI